MWLRYALLSTSLLALGCLRRDDSIIEKPVPKPKPRLTIDPNPERALFGQQIINIRHPLFPEMRIDSVTANTGHPGPLYRDHDFHSFHFNAQETDGSRVKFTINASLPSAEEKRVSLPPMEQTYRINRHPIPKIVVTKVDRVNIESLEPHPEDRVTLDASKTIDPENKELKFEWTLGEKIVHGPVFTATRGLFQQTPLTLKIIDGLGVLKLLLGIIIHLDNGDVVILPDPYKCTGMEIVAKKGETSLINSSLKLGPTFSDGDMLPVGKENANGDVPIKKGAEVYLGLTFEVRGTLEAVDGAELKQGQEKASTNKYKDIFPDKDGNVGIDVDIHSGKKPGATGKDDPTIKAPFNDTCSELNNLEKLPKVHDGCNNHPIVTRIYTNDKKIKKDDPNKNATFSKLEITQKGLYIDPKTGKEIMVWVGTHGMRLSSSYYANDISMKALFRTWMSPELAACNKYFKIIIETDGDGEVDENELTVLN